MDPALPEAPWPLVRHLTRAARRVPGAVWLLDPIRRRFLAREQHVVVEDFDRGLSMRLDLSEHMQSQIYWYGYYCRDLVAVLDQRLAPGDVVIDGGANIGEITLSAATRVTSTGHVYAFEPMPALANRLSRNVALNELPQVTVVRRGLSDRAGRAPIYATASLAADGATNEGLGSLYDPGDDARRVDDVDLVTLDAFVQSAGLDAVRLIKLDVEGAELPALKGATSTLERFGPDIIVELQTETARRAGYRPGDVLDFLCGFGYRFFRIGRHGRTTPIRATELRRFQNVLCTRE